MIEINEDWVRNSVEPVQSGACRYTQRCRFSWLYVIVVVRAGGQVRNQQEIRNSIRLSNFLQLT